MNKLEESRTPLRIFVMEKGEDSNVAVKIYGRRLLGDIRIEALRKQLLTEIENTLKSRFPMHLYHFAPKAKTWLRDC